MPQKLVCWPKNIMIMKINKLIVDNIRKIKYILIKGGGNMYSCDVLRALSNDTRIDILRYIDANGEVSVSDIQKYCDMSQSAVSQHLGFLRSAGIVKRRTDKQVRYYSIANDLPMQIIDVMDKFEQNQLKN